ncbi:hypothetical protein [Silanimonas algicola]
MLCFLLWSSTIGVRSSDGGGPHHPLKRKESGGRNVEIVGGSLLGAVGVIAAAALASALVQRLLSKQVNWYRAFALGVALVAGIVVADYFALSGAMRFAVVAGGIALLVALADLLPLFRIKSDA